MSTISISNSQFWKNRRKNKKKQKMVKLAVIWLVISIYLFCYVSSNTAFIQVGYESPKISKFLVHTFLGLHFVVFSFGFFSFCFVVGGTETREGVWEKKLIKGSKIAVGGSVSKAAKIKESPPRPGP